MSDLVYFKKSKLDTLANKINEKCGGVEPISLDEMIDKCLTTVENEECRKYFENRTDYKYCFGCASEIPYFVMNPKATDASNMFHYAKITEMTKLDFSNITNVAQCFTNCSKLKKVNINTSKVWSVVNLFNECTLLVDAGTLDFGSIPNDSGNRTGGCFNNCKALVEVRFVAKSIKRSLSFAHSPLLSTKSVQSIIDGLAIVSTAQTITFNKAIALSDEQKQSINEKGWTLVQA